MSETAKPSVTIVTGFLGAGKTTWLKHTLESPHGLRIGVVVNDVGAINIDAALVRRVEAGAADGRRAVVELTNGCVCCDVRDDLAEALAELAAGGACEHLVVECSGAAEPQPITRLFTERDGFGRSLGDLATLHAVLAVVDTPELLRLAPEAPSQREPGAGQVRPLGELMLTQIEGADVVTLNKADKLGPDELARATAIVRGVNATCEIHASVRGVLAPGVWPGPARFVQRDASPASWVRVLNAAAGRGAPGLHLAGPFKTAPALPVATSAEKFGLHTFLFCERRPFRTAAFRELWLRGLPGVVRAKGFFWTREQPDEIGFASLAGGDATFETAGTWAAALVREGVLTLDEVPEGIRGLWREPHGDRRQEIVFIGRAMDETSLRRDLLACLDEPALTTSDRP